MMLRGWLLTILVALIAVAGWAVIVAGMCFGGWWRVASAPVLAVFIGMIFIPAAFRQSECNNNLGDQK